MHAKDIQSHAGFQSSNPGTAAMAREFFGLVGTSSGFLVYTLFVVLAFTSTLGS
jgi:hypothetical protein